ncbi:uncharacterized protein LOC108468221 [Gossypium arboreum]|uniref:uncharacterized protein LOC108468221 n=1 Tax=Gossypium arboreum TaxID=29729 RepID=UPI000819188D|nr:uncharacterized protein LOC108468221 [Gossypium arboreum]
MDYILSGVQLCISNSMNHLLLATYAEGEILEALKGMVLTKASGADGFPAIFYQKYWHIVGKETCEFCLDILNNGHSLEDINRTQLVLIPKTANPSNLKNYRPISLCTVIYKIIAKTVANRLQKVLDGCIDDAQSAFVPGRLISDNVLLAYEVLHSFKNKKSGKKGSMALKLDMSKAYDRVEWPSIRGMMANMGFEDRFISLILHCVNSVQYSILINGEEGSNFRASRGLRQGDPLSPYLFLFCGERLSALMRLASQEGKIFCAKVCRSAPPITHLMFADDCILFGEVSRRGICVLKDILEEYEACSGQCILNLRCSTNPERYLGLPNVGCRLLRNPNSLLARTLKAKYFKESDFLNSRLGNLPSFTWQSIWAAKGLLLKGLGWRIGNGKHVSIWEDAWILGNEDFKIQHTNVNMSILKVADLIEANGRKWNSELICNTFSEQEVERILYIPLSLYEHEDFVIWRGEPTGEYSVQSGNKFIHEGEVKTGSQITVFVKKFMLELDGLKLFIPVERLCIGSWIIGSKIVMNSNIPSAFAAEAVACLHALQLGLHLGLKEVEIEGDSWTTCVFLFTNRDANEVAHLITSEGIRRRESTYLANQVFSGAVETVAEDRRRTESMRDLRSRRRGEEDGNVSLNLFVEDFSRRRE